jgi:hypothetical protein
MRAIYETCSKTTLTIPTDLSSTHPYMTSDASLEAATSLTCLAQAPARRHPRMLLQGPPHPDNPPPTQSRTMPPP